MRTFLSGQVRGKNRAGTGEVAGGFQYTLNAFPNHPAALSLMEQLGRRLKSEEPQGTLPLECWYVRAFKLVPDDPVVWVMYGVYLAHRGRVDEAIRQLDRATPAVQDSPALLHQLGLGYLAAKQYEKAQLAAMRAGSLGFQLTSLPQQLKSIGRWDNALEATFASDLRAKVQAAPAASANSAQASAPQAVSLPASARVGR